MASIKMRLNFAPMLGKIQDAGGDVDSAAKRLANECAKTVETSLVNECNASGVPHSITGAIRSNVKETSGGNVHEIEVGWEMGGYNPKDPSAGYKAVFLNYGTPRREVKQEHTHLNTNGEWVTVGKNRGAIQPRGFIGRAREDANKKLKKVKKELLDEIVKELE